VVARQTVRYTDYQRSGMNPIAVARATLRNIKRLVVDRVTVKGRPFTP
jgi:hypothetical protein